MDSGLVIYNQGTCALTVRQHAPILFFSCHDNGQVISVMTEAGLLETPLQVPPSIASQIGNSSGSCEEAVIRVPSLQQYWNLTSSVLGTQYIYTPPSPPPSPPPPPPQRRPGPR